MNEQDLLKILEILEPYFQKKSEKKTNTTTSKTAKFINAIVYEDETTKKQQLIDNSKITVYTLDSPDTKFIVKNPNLAIKYSNGDSVQLIYYDSLKTAKIFSKN